MVFAAFNAIAMGCAHLVSERFARICDRGVVLDRVIKQSVVTMLSLRGQSYHWKDFGASEGAGTFTMALQ
jgi:hypothetical protein